MKYKGRWTKNGPIVSRYLGPLYFILLSITLLLFKTTFEPKPAPLPQASSPACLYSNQAHDNLENVVTTAILQAQESIFCMIYSLNDEQVIEALKKKASDGVSVVVVHDPVASPDAAIKLGDQIKTTTLHHRGLMHNKLLSIDHKQAWLGSANFTKDSLLFHANLMLGIESPEIAQAIEKKTKNEKIPSPIIVESQNQKMEVRFLPDDKKALERVLSLLQGAKKTVKVAMFTFTHPLLVDALVEAKNRGIQVDVVLDNDSSKKTSKIAYNRLRKEGVSVRTSARRGLLHEKIAIIDNETLIAGSANWTKAAFTTNDEALVILYPLTEEQKNKLFVFWETTIKESKEKT